MEQYELTTQAGQSAKYEEWILEFDTDLDVRFDDESDFSQDNEA